MKHGVKVASQNNLGNASKTVRTCYDLLDVALAGGIEDFTDGKYLGDPSLSYEEAQNNQVEWLLDTRKAASRQIPLC